MKVRDEVPSVAKAGFYLRLLVGVRDPVALHVQHVNFLGADVLRQSYALDAVVLVAGGPSNRGPGLMVHDVEGRRALPVEPRARPPVLDDAEAIRLIAGAAPDVVAHPEVKAPRLPRLKRDALRGPPCVRVGVALKGEQDVHVRPEPQLGCVVAAGGRWAHVHLVVEEGEEPREHLHRRVRRQHRVPALGALTLESTARRVPLPRQVRGERAEGDEEDASEAAATDDGEKARVAAVVVVAVRAGAAGLAVAVAVRVQRLQLERLHVLSAVDVRVQATSGDWSPKCWCHLPPPKLALAL
mmetsp:Transcript_12821/g.35180  ORF Transcript_12821/g.35180 Transcript_12821/m.35180 type:complete len:298 (-) Transcript_12821:13-906(-)